MKRIFTALLLTGMIATQSTVLAASVDLSRMSFDELKELQNEVNLAMWESDGWQEVEVPIGVYEVGKEIPAGDWIVFSDRSYIMVASENDNGDLSGYSFGEGLKNNEEMKITCYDGNWIEITSDSATFKPYVTSFSFK